MFRQNWRNVTDGSRHRPGLQTVRALSATLAIMLITLAAFAVSGRSAIAGSAPGVKTADKPLSPDAPAAGRQIMGYFPAWGPEDSGFLVKNLVSSGSAAKMTTLLYAFSNISNGKCALGQPDADLNVLYDAASSVSGVADTAGATVLRGSFHQLQELKAQYPDLKVVISIGGWSWSSGFSAMAATEEGRQAFVQSCIDLYIKGQFDANRTVPGVFDGIDVDWEYPGSCGATCDFSAADPANYVQLLGAFRTRLDALTSVTGKTYTLSIAAPAGAGAYGVLQLANTAAYLNTVNLMAYDMHGAWESTTNFNAPLYGPSGGVDANTVSGVIKAYLDAGVPAGKIIMGIPFYGRGWTGVHNANHGIYQTATGPAPSSSAPGEENYNVLKTLSGFSGYRDPQTQSYSIFNGSTFWSFDDPTAITAKMSYARAKNLGGAMFWDASGDDAQGSLITAMYNGLAPAPTATATRTNTLTATPAGATSTPGARSTATATRTPLAFSDVHPNDYFYTPVQFLAASGAISGYADNTFRPFNNTTRGQMVKIIVIAAGITLQTPATPSFRDVSTANPFYSFIETAVARQIVSGYTDGTFRPNTNVTRGQLAKIVALAANWSLSNPASQTFRDVSPSNPFYRFVETAAQKGVISGYVCGANCIEFRPGANAIRGQIAKIVYLALQAR